MPPTNSTQSGTQVPGIIVALDYPQIEQAARMAKKLAGHPGLAGFKVGLELLMGPGPASVAVIRQLDQLVFVDAKLHDIPDTVHRAASRLGRLGAKWLTVHASGGQSMVEAAVAGLAEQDPEAQVMAVTVLTSLDDSRLNQIQGQATVGKQVARLASLTAKAGAAGVVCSARELGVVSDTTPELTKVTPGIRREGAENNDQQRVATPAEAAKWGADMIVVGRAVTTASEPVEALQEIYQEMVTAYGTSQV